MDNNQIHYIERRKVIPSKITYGFVVSGILVMLRCAMVKLLIVIFIVLSACGGGGELSFVPGDIAPEYEDLTLEQLKLMQ